MTDQKELIVKFCQETTIHGVKYIPESTSLYIKLIWAVIVTSALVGNTIQLMEIIQKYLEFPIQEVSYRSPDLYEFPHITFCNIQGVSPSKYRNISGDNTTYLWQYLNNIAIAGEYETILSQPYVIKVNMPEDEVHRIGFSLGDFIVSCMYAGKPCDMSDFNTHVIGDLFLCHTFKGDISAADFAGQTGPFQGLSVILYMENEIWNDDGHLYNSHSVISHGVGARLQVHYPNTLPSVWVDGFDIPVGFSTSVGMEAKKIVKLSVPYSNDECMEDKHLDEYPEYKYTATVCDDLCITEYCYKICGCKTSFTDKFSSTIPESTPYCLFLNFTEDIPLEGFHINAICESWSWLSFNEAIRNNSFTCDHNCKEECIKHEYNTQISQSVWPSSQSVYSFIYEYIYNRKDIERLNVFTELLSSLNAAESNQELVDIVHSNFARVNLYFKANALFVTEQQVAYPLSQLFSDIGGTLGLWIGLSLISIVETITFVFNLCVNGIKKLKRSQTRNTNMVAFAFP